MTLLSDHIQRQDRNFQGRCDADCRQHNVPVYSDRRHDVT